MDPHAKRIVCLPAAKLRPGLHVAKAVLRADGAVMLSSGTVLDQDELSRLHQRGVEAVFVELDDPRTAEQRSTDAAAVQARCDHIFRGDTSDARDALKAAVLVYRLEANG